MQRHDFDVVSFLFGLLFLGLAGAWLITEESINPDVADWFWPVVLVVGGAVVLSSTLKRSRFSGTGPASQAPHENEDTGHSD